MCLFCTYKFAVGSVGKKVCYLVAGSCCSSYQECGRNELRRHRESNQCSRRKGKCVEILRFQRINKENTFMSTSDFGDGTQRLVSCLVWTPNFADSSLRKAAVLRCLAWIYDDLERSRCVTLPWLKISGSRQTLAMAEKEKRKKKKTVWLCCAWLLSGTTRQPIPSTIVQRCWCPSLWRRILEIQRWRDCYLGNMTSHFSYLLSWCLA